jgi:hypothetical protein
MLSESLSPDKLPPETNTQKPEASPEKNSSNKKGAA